MTDNPRSKPTLASIALILAVVSMSINIWLIQKVSSVPTETGNISSSRIVLINPYYGTGKVVIGYDTSIGPIPSVSMYDQSGSPRLVIGLIGDHPSISMNDSSGAPVMEFGVGRKDFRYPGPAIVVVGKSGRDHNIISALDSLDSRSISTSISSESVNSN